MLGFLWYKIVFKIQNIIDIYNKIFILVNTKSKNKKNICVMRRFFDKIMTMNIIKLYCVTLFFHFLWSFIVAATLYLSGVEFSQHVASSSDLVNSFLIVPMCALVEEGLFRWGPMVLFFFGLNSFSRLFKLEDGLQYKIEKYGIAIIVLVSSVIFGCVHGNVFNILLQGVGGLIFFMFYLRTFYKERIEGKVDKYQLRPLASSTIYHTLSNSLLIFL